MSAPKKNAQPAPPTNAAEAEEAALRDLHFQTFQAAKKGSPTAVLPFGARIDASKHVNARYRMNDGTKVWGAEEKIIKEEFLREHQGWTYMWPLKDGMKTQAYIASGRYKEVPFDMIDRSSPLAEVAASPTGQTIWMRHILVAVHPGVYAEEVTSAEEYAVARTAMNRHTAEQQLTEQFGKAGYKGEASITDIKQER